MLRVPQIRQPHRSACLPTCVWAVLNFKGRVVSFEDVLEACDLDPEGANPVLSAAGLADAGFDIDPLEEPTIERIRRALDDHEPLIATLPVGSVDDNVYAHAVVVCDLRAEQLVVMDPAVGEYVEIEVTRFLLQVEKGLAGTFLIGLDAITEAMSKDKHAT